jgi:hypothetical protein
VASQMFVNVEERRQLRPKLRPKGFQGVLSRLELRRRSRHAGPALRARVITLSKRCSINATMMAKARAV